MWNDGKVEERQRVVGQISRGCWMGSTWKPVTGHRTVTWKTGMLLENGRMNQEFPYVIAAIIASSNWCRRSLGRWWSHPPSTRRDHKAARTSFFFFIFLHVRDVGRLKRHKLERSISRQMRGWRVSVQYGRQTWPSFHIVQLFRSDQIVELFIDISQIVRYVFEAM